MASEPPFWYVIYTYPRQEQKIAALLTRQKLHAYLPKHRVKRQWSDRVKQLLTPLFPNYLFVYISPSDRNKVLKIPGVARFLALEGKPTVLSEQVIGTIRHLETANAESHPHLLTGDRVLVTNGPFAGLEGVLFQRMGKARFGLRLDGIQQYLSLEICESMLQKI